MDYLLEEREKLIKQEIEKNKLHGVANTEAREKIVAKHILSLRVADISCGSGHILLSAARRIADRYASLLEESDLPSPTGTRHAIRLVIRNCIYGVDKNPLAVELCKVSLWLEAHNPGEPLNFLDHHIKCGDSIVGLAHRDELENGIPDEAFKTLSGDEKEIASALLKKNKAERKSREDKTAGVQLTTADSIENTVHENITEYHTLSKMPENTPDEIQAKQKAYKKFINGKGYTWLKAMADLQMAQFFIPKTTANKDKLITDADFRTMLSGYAGWQSPKTALATMIAMERKFFHWFLEFPEVFNEGGFDCILGNPPFLGDKKLKNAFGEQYLEYCRYYYFPAGITDLIVYFLRRIFGVLKIKSFLSIIATNTVSQGDAKDGGLDIVVAQGGDINFAINSIKWPGKAEVVVSLLAIFKGKFLHKKYVGHNVVDSISTLLREGNANENAFLLFKNQDKSFIGNYVLGTGFILDNDEANNLIRNNPKNVECIFPYLNGDDLNSSPNQKANRWVINFYDLSEEESRIKFPTCFGIIEDRVKPERLMKADKASREKWWQHARIRPKLYHAISNNDKVLVIAQVSKTVAFSFVNINQIYDSKLIVLAFDNFYYFAILQSNFHYNWAWKYCTTMKNDLSYTPEKILETFPFPENTTQAITQQLEQIGEQYHEHRRLLMLSMQLGLTKTYNAFHAKEIQAGTTTASLQSLNKQAIEKQGGKEVWNLWNHLQKTQGVCNIEEAIEGIVKLRAKHVQMDNAVLEAYNWQDIQLKHDFYEVEYLPDNDRVRYTIHPEARKEVLKRLLQLNHKIHEEEMKALPEVVKKKTPAKKKSANNEVGEPEAGYGNLFTETEE